jgi:hypothetical protein
MKKTGIAILIVAVMAAVSYWLVQVSPKWEGVDESVVEKYAQEAGHPSQKAYIDTDRGDVLLFFFLIAGVAGGFVSGYCYRELFGPEKNEGAKRKSVA